MVQQSEQSSALQQRYQYVFTVFTAAYNRANTLHRVYESLRSQTYRDFEWLIIDNGSTDNTHELVKQWQQESSFPIRYIYYQQNQGLHGALNHGVQEAKGELFLQLDSDDACIPEALERFKYHWGSIPIGQRKNFVGVTALCKDHNGVLVGTSFPSDSLDSDCLEMDYRYKVTGEKWGFQEISVLRQFPYPEDVRNTCISPNFIWHQIARTYKTRFVNEILRVYWTDQPSLVNGRPNPGKSALGCRMYHLMVLNDEPDWFSVAPLSFLRSAIHYCRFSFHLGIQIRDQFTEIKSFTGKGLWFVALPLSYLIVLRDKILFNCSRP